MVTRTRHLLAAGLALGLCGCDYLEDLPDRLKTCHDVSVKLTNDYQYPTSVNLLVEGENVSEETWLASGSSRQVPLCLEKGHSEKFRAALQDGTVLGVANCPASRSSHEGVSVSVVWGLNGFSCVGW